VTVPGRRYEIDVNSDGEIETECFMGTEGIHSGMDEVEKILKEFGSE
jgi:hypothetical protein